MGNLEAFRAFEQQVDALARRRRPKVGVGLLEPKPDLLESLKRSAEYADILLVGPEDIAGSKDFAVETPANPEEHLAELLASDRVEGILRGTLDDFKVWEAYQRRTGEKTTLGPALLSTPTEYQFFMSPVSNPDGWAKEDRLRIAEALAAFAHEWKIPVSIAVFTGERHDTYPRKKHIREGVTGVLNQTYEDAQWIVEQLTATGRAAKNWAIDLNPAIEAGSTILLPVNGLVGNQLFRMLMACGGKFLASMRVGPSRPYFENTRTDRDFSFHIKWLAATINRRKT